MTKLDTAVFLFGMLVSALVSAGILLPLYGHARLQRARAANTEISPGMKRLARLLGAESD
ncbi:MAG: hypothetical protein K8S98_05610 [Planctomycetes bacterium]|nr:hypothetical protein [Planctomycetota bacterium]